MIVLLRLPEENDDEKTAVGCLADCSRVTGSCHRARTLDREPGCRHSPSTRPSSTTLTAIYRSGSQLVGTELGIFFDNGNGLRPLPHSRATLTNLVTQEEAHGEHCQARFTSGSGPTEPRHLGGHRPGALLLRCCRGTPGITLLNGLFVWSFDAQGNETGFRRVGRTATSARSSPGP